jgi:hypothetical protein
MGNLGSWNAADFPGLNDKNCLVTSKATKSYNCIAWAAIGSAEAPWWWPIPDYYYWPPGVPREETLVSFVQAFETIGYISCQNGTLESGFEKVALYANRMPWGDVVPTHAARQLADGKWTSKLGSFEDVEHQAAADVNGPIYGAVVKYLKRPISSPEAS